MCSCRCSSKGMLKRTSDIASQIVISETVIDLVGVVRSFLEHGGDGSCRCVHQKLSVAPVAVQNTRETPKGVPLERLGEDVGNLILRADSHQLNFSCQHQIAAVVVVLGDVLGALVMLSLIHI